MQKTKLGITISGLAAAIYLTCLFGGYIPAIILTGYVLMVEENEWLRRNAVKAIVLMMIFSVFIYGINLIPNVINCFEDMARAFGVSVLFFHNQIPVTRSSLLLSLAVLQIPLFFLFPPQSL